MLLIFSADNNYKKNSYLALIYIYLAHKQLKIKYFYLFAEISAR